MIERQIDIETPDGTMTTFVVHPEEGGPYPVVLYLMDAPGIRPALRDMASRLATVGYYVMLPYLFYRGGPYREFGESDEDMHARRELMGTVSREGIVPDAEAMLRVAADDPMARDGKVGAVGFCMSGRLVMALLQELPERFAAGASIHGGWVVGDGDDSPHRHVDRIEGELYFGWADDDPTAPREQIDVMAKALTEAGITHRIDFMEGAVHGFAPPGEPPLRPHGLRAPLGAGHRPLPAYPLTGPRTDVQLTPAQAVRNAHAWFEVNSGWAPPDDDTLEEWLADGVCRCPDECLVAPQAWCEHGLASWWLILEALRPGDLSAEG